MKVHLTTTILLIIFNEVVAQGIPISPCPKIFQYRFDGNEWFGLIAIRNLEVQALQIRVTLSMRGKPTTNYLGEIELLTRGQFSMHAPVLYKIRFPKHNFPPKLVLISANNQVICFGSADHSIFMTQIQLEHTRKLTYIPDKKSPSSSFMVESGMAVGKEISPSHEFGSKPLPHIQFKKKPFHSTGEVCGQIDKSLDFRLPHRMQRKLTHPAAQNSTSTSSWSSANVTSNHDDWRFEPDDGDDSQSPVFVSPSDYDDLESDEDDMADSILFVDEQNATTATTLPTITRGAWPWLAAIYVNNLTSLDFQCCGTLVSARVVISSAHCFQMFNQRYTANEVLVFLGRHNLKNWNEEGSLAAPVDGIYLHPDYNKQLSNYDADIAVLILKDEVRFNTFIQPVCLWSGSSQMEYIVGEHGIVIGWSFERSNATSSPTVGPTMNANTDTANSIPTILKAPIVSNDKCHKSNRDFLNLSSNRTFCAGIVVDNRPKPGIYTGISGAGLMIRKNNRWMLRGTVSATLPATATSTDSIRYMIYADVAKFIDWIMAFII